MGKGRIENLNLTPTKEEARRKGRNGGIASGKARREKAKLNHCLDLLLNKIFIDDEGNEITGAELMAVKAFEQAIEGDWKAWELARDTAGQKPVDKVAISDVSDEDISEVESFVKNDSKTKEVSKNTKRKSGTSR